MKNILIISSSPRKKGNSQILCEHFKKGAEAKGCDGCWIGQESKCFPKSLRLGYSI